MTQSGSVGHCTTVTARLSVHVCDQTSRAYVLVLSGNMSDILLKIKNSVAEKKKTSVAQYDLQKWGLRGTETCQLSNVTPSN